MASDNSSAYTANELNTLFEPGQPNGPIYYGYTREEMRSTFASVQDPADWKAPIQVTVTGDAVELVVRAIEFYTATVPTIRFDLESMTFCVTSEGYRAGPAGDH